MPEPYPPQELMSTTVNPSGARDQGQSLRMYEGITSCLATSWGGSSAVLWAGTTISHPCACAGVVQAPDLQVSCSGSLWEGKRRSVYLC